MAKILIADHDAAQRQILDMLLSLDGHEVLHAADAREAFQILRSETPVLAVLELDLPGAPGDAVCHRMRRVGRLVDVPVVLAAPQDGRIALDADTRARVRSSGADLVLRKPLSEKNLRERVTELIARPRGGGRDGGRGGGRDVRSTGVIVDALGALERGEGLDPLPPSPPRETADPLRALDAAPTTPPQTSGPPAPPATPPATPSHTPSPAPRPPAGPEAGGAYPATPDDLRSLRHENARLRSEVDRLRRRVAELEAEDESGLREALERKSRALDDLRRRYTLLRDAADTEGSASGSSGRRGLFGRRRD